MLWLRAGSRRSPPYLLHLQYPRVRLRESGVLKPFPDQFILRPFAARHQLGPEYQAALTGWWGWG
jgi:hypothetical protein